MPIPHSFVRIDSRNLGEVQEFADMAGVSWHPADLLAMADVRPPLTLEERFNLLESNSITIRTAMAGAGGMVVREVMNRYLARRPDAR
jgi:hypothetical protein